MRTQLTNIMRVLGLLSETDDVGRRIRATEADFHFASLVRCSTSLWDTRKGEYTKSGSSILPAFLAAAATRQVAEACTEQFLSALPERTRLVLLLGNSAPYIEGCKSLFGRLYPGIETLNEVAYSDGAITWVHTIHAAAQGNYVPEWLAGADTAVGRKMQPARSAVEFSGVLDLLAPHRVVPVRAGLVPVAREGAKVSVQKPEPSPPGGNLELEVVGAFETAGYRSLPGTKKMAAFRSPSGTQTLYLDKAALRAGRIDVRVHPELDPMMLGRLPGVRSVSHDYRFHSNMTAFPARMHLGMTPDALRPAGDRWLGLRADRVPGCLSRPDPVAWDRGRDRRYGGDGETAERTRPG